MNTYFVDTFYLLAWLHPSDEAHERAQAMARALRGGLVTAQWVLIEVADGCAGPVDRERVAEFLSVFEKASNVEVLEASSEWYHRGLERYRERRDKEWSLTDCISFLVMEERGIQEALTGDHHFEQAGFVPLLK